MMAMTMQCFIWWYNKKNLWKKERKNRQSETILTAHRKRKHGLLDMHSCLCIPECATEIEHTHTYTHTRSAISCILAYCSNFLQKKLYGAVANSQFLVIACTPFSMYSIWNNVRLSIILLFYTAHIIIIHTAEALCNFILGALFTKLHCIAYIKWGATFNEIRFGADSFALCHHHQNNNPSHCIRKKEEEEREKITSVTATKSNNKRPCSLMWNDIHSK